MNNRVSKVMVGLLLAVLAIGGAACSPSNREALMWVIVRSDGSEDVVQTEAVTVRGLLAELGLEPTGLDQVDPGQWTELYPGMTVTITRVVERRERVPIPHAQQILRDESRSPGENRMLVEGVDGEEELVYHVVLEQGREVRRELLERRIVQRPRAEVLIVGIKGMVPPASLPGLVAYVSAGNGWLIDGRSGEKRPLTFEGDLDERVLALSSDGVQLLFSRWGGDGAGDPLNSLWLLDTRLMEEPARSLGVHGVLDATWGPTDDWFLYTTAERREGTPGWRANNDLYVSSTDGVTLTSVLDANHSGLYGWWGTNYFLSPDGSQVVYARANEIGLIDLPSGIDRLLLAFPAYHTYAEWVWLPFVSWSPDGQWLVATIHVATDGPGAMEDSPVFDLYVLQAEGAETKPIVHSVGMWSMPRWSARPTRTREGNLAEIAFLKARRPTTSDESPYDVFITDRDGSFEQMVLSAGETEELTVPICEWSPLGDQLVVASRGNLQLVELAKKDAQALTADGLSGQPCWVVPEE